MELYNAVKSDLISIWNTIGIPVVVVWGVIFLLVLIVIIYTFSRIIGGHRRMRRRMDRW